jgi:hypothetical protein
MKIELLRNCFHGSEIATYMETNENERKIIKVSSTVNGIKDLRSEIAGWEWYQKIRYPEFSKPICRVAAEKINYLKIEIDYIQGQQGEYLKGLVYNKEVIRKVINHYSQIWPHSETGLVPLHGDFSLENILINDEGVHIFDWEHFSYDAVPWGFDPIYLLFEALWFSFEKTKKLKKEELYILKENILLLEDHHLSKNIARHPLSFLISFISVNKLLWRTQANKFSVLNFSEKQINFIENSIGLTS